MRYRKIHIIGAAGSGKTFVAAKLSEAYGIETFDLDDIFWDNRAGGYGVMAPDDERDEALERILERGSWIIEGVYSSMWIMRSFEEADIIIVLMTPLWLRDYRILRRFIKRKLGLMPSKKKETLRALFRLVKWNHRFESWNLPLVRCMVDGLDCKSVDCRTLEEVFAALEE